MNKTLLFLEKYLYIIFTGIFIVFCSFIYIDYNNRFTLIDEWWLMAPQENMFENTYRILGLTQLSDTLDLDFSEILSEQAKEKWYSSIWGEGNLLMEWWKIKNIFPKGSYKPSINPVWGVWFVYNLRNQSYTHVLLSYKVFFPEGFDFVKGWKLPWFCGWTCPRGWTSSEKGFSTRFMWRANGDLEVYSYLPIRKNSKGESIGRGMYRFVPWKSYTISQEIKLNTPGINNGILVVRVNDEIVYIKDGLNFRSFEDIKIDKILYSTFFGGGDISWATPIDTFIEFSDFELKYNKKDL